MQRSAQHMAGQPCRAAPPPVCLPVSCARIMCRAEGGEVVGQVPHRPAPHYATLVGDAAAAALAALEQARQAADVTAAPDAPEAKHPASQAHTRTRCCRAMPLHLHCPPAADCGVSWRHVARKLHPPADHCVSNPRAVLPLLEQTWLEHITNTSKSPMMQARWSSAAATPAAPAMSGLCGC